MSKSKSAAEWEAYALANGGKVVRSAPIGDIVTKLADPKDIQRLHASSGVECPITEKEFMAKVIDYAKDHSWRTYHTFRSDKSEPGFPDLVLARRHGVNSGRLVFAELKSEIGKPTKAQLEWLRELEQCGQEAYLWRPSDWATIVEILR